MKKAYLIIALTFLIVSLNAQFKWANRGGLWAYDYGYGIVTDNAGNVYVAGKFEFNAIFSNTITVTCQGNHDAYIAKYDPNGKIMWVKTLGGANGDYAWSISTDGTNNLYISGEIEGTGTPILFSNSTTTLNTVGDNDIFFAKYDLDGNLIWAKSEGSLKSERAMGITHDQSGNVYICGHITDNGVFNGQPVSGYGGKDIIVAKYDANGAFQWVQKAGGAGRDEAKSIMVDNAGGVYIAGLYTGQATFGTMTKGNPDQFQEAYIAKLNASDGNFQWVKHGDSQYDDAGWSLTKDNAGSIYMCGEFNSYISFEDPSKAVATTKNADVFVAKFDSFGSVQWIKNAGGQEVDRARGIGTNGTNIFITGQFGHSANFGPYNLIGADSSDIFLAALDGNGNFLWANDVDGVPDTFEGLGFESGIAITANGSGVYATGSMLKDSSNANSVAADFSGIGLTGYSRTDMWVAAVGLNGVGLTEDMLSDEISIYPNPTSGNVTLNLNKTTGSIQVSVYNAVGQLVSSNSYSGGGQVNLDLNHNNDGVYLLQITTPDNSVLRKKLIVQH
jgi:hypothetical protein